VIDVLIEEPDAPPVKRGNCPVGHSGTTYRAFVLVILPAEQFHLVKEPVSRLDISFRLMKGFPSDFHQSKRQWSMVLDQFLLTDFPHISR
jgi:hypothetical protein